MKRLLHGILAIIPTIILAQSSTTSYGTGAGTGGSYSSYFGYYAGRSASTGSAFHNSLFGYKAGERISSGDYNTGVGSSALYTLTTGVRNTGIGYQSLLRMTSGSYNTGVGYGSMLSTTTSSHNTGIGYNNLRSNTTGSYNTAVGSETLYKNFSSMHNSTLGYRAMHNNTSGSYNTSVGSQSLRMSTSGTRNTATGYQSGYSVTTGSYNTSVGYSSLSVNRTGSYNTAIGYGTGMFLSNDLTNTTSIGNGAFVTCSNQVQIGNSSVTQIGGFVPWSTVSDGRFKSDIQENVAGLEFINSLRPVSYQLDKEKINRFLGMDNVEGVADNKLANKRYTGFVAQEVAELVDKNGYVFEGVKVPAPDCSNSYYTIRYSEFVVPLVKAVQELSKELEEQRDLVSLMLAKHEEIVLEVEEDQNNPTPISLSQNRPNPANGITTISMTLPQTSNEAKLVVYNLKGEKVHQVEILERGSVEISLSATTLKPGIYLYHIMTETDISATKKMVIE